VSEPICDITEVAFTGDSDAFSTIASTVDVSAAAATTPSAIYQTVIEAAADGSTSYWDRFATIVNVGATATTVPLDHLQAVDTIDVSAMATSKIFSVLHELAAVSAAGSVQSFQSNPRDIAIVAAAAAVNAVQAGPFRTLVNVRARGATTITNARAVRQIVDVAAAAAAAAAQSLLARNYVTVSAHAGTDIAGDMARRRDLVMVAAHASVLAAQKLLAYSLVEVEAYPDAEIVEAAAGGAAWTAATETLGMSRHEYPERLIGLAAIGDAMLAIGAGGAYLLNGDDDGAGAPPITATAVGPLVDTGDSALKRPVALYIAYASTNPVQVAVGETSTGVERTWPYTSPPFNQSAPRPIRVPTGKGLRSRYLRFTISNTGGAPMRVFAAEYDYLQTGRRT
jgi:hypothetical protein